MLSSTTSSLYVLCGVTIAWLLLLAVKEVWTRTIRSRNLGTRTRQLSSKLQQQQDDRRLQGQIGWFWLVVSWHSGAPLEKETDQGTSSVRRSSSRIRKNSITSILKNFYTFGTICALIAFLVVPLYLLFNLYQTLARDTTVETARTGVNGIAGQHQQASGLLIPGLTVPIRETFILVLSGLAPIAWHEAGHAITAIIAKVDITSYALILIFMFPGAYVALSTSSLDALTSPSARLRIITAGIWHNFVLCLFIWGGMRMNVLGRDSGLYGWVGFEDYNERGVVVMLVDQESPLYGLLMPQHLITHLDDLELHDSHRYKHWDNYLLSRDDKTRGSSSYDNLGYCVDSDTFTSLPVSCCNNQTEATITRGQTTVAGQSREVCFIEASGDVAEEIQEEARGHCLDPGEILSNTRCTTTCSQPDQICIHPSPTAHLLRITTKNLSNGNEEVIMYRGDRGKLWNDVKVGRYIAPLGWMQSLPLDIESFWIYTSSISLSLALFNLLPLPRLDGGEILDLFLSSNTGFMPVLPLSREFKSGIQSPYNQGSKEGRLDRILEQIVRQIQRMPIGSGEMTKGTRTKTAKRVLQVSVAVLAGLNFIGILYGQVRA